ncbi:MAG: ThuA domain-containing protein [Eubacteriales bacterium]
MKIRVTIWNEFLHEQRAPEVKALYPSGIHGYLQSVLADCPDMEVRLADLSEPDCGLPEEVLAATDVLLWWGHMAHQQVSDTVVERVRARVLAGMGFLPLHSAHHSKPFRQIVGATGNLRWGREQRAIVWNLMPSHPIAAGIPSHFELFEEMYGEPFFIPPPDELIFATWFEDGNLLRGGATFRRGLGRIFYFHPGHESCRSFFDPHVQQIIKNGIRWAAPTRMGADIQDLCIHQKTPVVQNQ